MAVFLARVFAGKLLLPQYFLLGPIEVHYYGIFMAAAVLSGYLLAVNRAKFYNLSITQADRIIFWLVVFGFIGARLYHVASSANYYWQHPLEMFKVWEGGLSIYGAVIAGVIFVYFISKTYNLKPTTLLDWLAPSLLLGQIIGRFGNFFNYELYGYPTNLPWKMFVPEQFRYTAYASFQYFHPLFLYEALGNAIILFILLKKFGEKSIKGTLFFWYLLLYNALRFFLEFLRIDSTFLNGVRINAYVSLALVFVSVFALFRIYTHDKVPQVYSSHL